MAKDKKIKFYAHPFHSINLTRPAAVRAARLAKIFQKMGKMFFSVCFHIGQTLILSSRLVARLIVKQFTDTRSSLKKRHSNFTHPDFAKALIIFLIFCLCGYGVLQTVNLIARALEVKSKISLLAMQGGGYLDQAKQQISSSNFEGAQNNFALAYQSFSRGQQEITNTKTSILAFVNLFPQTQDGEKLLQASSLISQSGEGIVNLLNNFKSLKISQEGLHSDAPSAQILQSIDQQSLEVAAKLYKASDLLETVNPKNVPKDLQENFIDLRAKVALLSTSFQNFHDVFSLFASLIEGQKTFLVLFENNNELRATGGFMGTYGIVKTNGGVINKINVSSVYDLDGQLTSKIQPPYPILNVNNRWYLRDSNWFANFPDSAKKIISFYEKEGGETPDAVIVLTPKLITDWLQLTGPIAMPRYDLTLSSQNFVELIEAASTQSTESVTNTPKQVLADLVPVMLQKFEHLDPSLWPQVLDSLQNNLNAKQLVIYSKNQDTQSQLSNFHWAGEVLPTDRDYLSVVSSNLGATKSDLNVDQNIDLTTTISDSGEVTNELEITRTNHLAKMEGTTNTSFIRIFVPEGSRLVSNIGFDYKDLDNASDSSFKVDPDVYLWTKSATKDIISGTTTGQEAGKTFFGNWIILEGGQSKTVKLTYVLPFQLKDIDRYSLLLQKQMGTLNFPFSWKLEFAGRHLQWQNFQTTEVKSDSLSSSLTLDRDYLLGTVFSK